MRETQTILLVDDNHDIIQGARMRLGAAGYDTLTANDGEQCIDVANEESPDAIVLDVRMPGKNGLTVLKELQQAETTRRIPVVMLSASIVDQQAALDAGARYFLTKPYRGKQLVDTLNVVLSDSSTTN